MNKRKTKLKPIAIIKAPLKKKYPAEFP